MTLNLTIAIDGPAGAGKSTVAKKVARRLGFLYIDTGAMYRSVAYEALQRGVDLLDEDALTELSRMVDIALTVDPGNKTRVLLDNKEVTGEIRTPEVSRVVSLVARVPGVRREMVRRQREMAAPGGVVMEGRDIGTAVLPKADFKFFLTASPLERAKRRARELDGRGHRMELEQLAREIEERDRLDSTRETDPLKPAADAEIIDCSDMDADRVAELIAGRVLGGAM